MALSRSPVVLVAAMTLVRTTTPVRMGH